MLIYGCSHLVADFILGFAHPRAGGVSPNLLGVFFDLASCPQLLVLLTGPAPQDGDAGDEQANDDRVKTDEARQRTHVDTVRRAALARAVLPQNGPVGLVQKQLLCADIDGDAGVSFADRYVVHVVVHTLDLVTALVVLAEAGLRAGHGGEGRCASQPERASSAETHIDVEQPPSAQPDFARPLNHPTHGQAHWATPRGHTVPQQPPRLQLRSCRRSQATLARSTAERKCVWPRGSQALTL